MPDYTAGNSGIMSTFKVINKILSLYLKDDVQLETNGVLPGE